MKKLILLAALLSTARLRPARPPDPAAQLRDAALRERHRRLGYARRPHHRGRPAHGGDRGRGAGARLGGAAADRLGLRQCPYRDLRHAGLGARRGDGRRSSRPSRSASSSPRSAIAARRRRAASRRRWSASRASPRSRPRRTRRCAAASSSSPTICRPIRTARATACSARRAGRGRPSPAARARSASSSARSAPIITATRIPACRPSPRRPPDPGRRAVHPRRRAVAAHPAPRHSRCGCG